MPRISPPELDFEFPGPYWSIKTTDRPISRRLRAVHPPNTPAPTIAMSAVTLFALDGCDCGPCGSPVARRTAAPPTASVPALTPALRNIRRFMRASSKALLVAADPCVGPGADTRVRPYTEVIQPISVSPT